jgi:pantoate--beta-alanine ligase
MSSRNVYLSAAERERALSLSWALREATRRVVRGERDATRLIELMKTILRAADVQLDYVAICNGETLEPLEQITDPAVALIAGRVGSTRLIDNASLLPQIDAALMAPQILPRA